MKRRESNETHEGVTSRNTLRIYVSNPYYALLSMVKTRDSSPSVDVIVKVSSAYLASTGRLAHTHVSDQHKLEKEIVRLGQHNGKYVCVYPCMQH